MDIMQVVELGLMSMISHLRVLRSWIAAQCPVETMFKKWSCSEVSGAVR